MIGSKPLSEIIAKLPGLDEERAKEEYLAILEVFSEFLEDTLPELSDSEEIIEALSDLRAEFAIRYALEGFDLDYETALELIREDVGLSDEDEERRKIVVAAIDNIVDFTVMSEYHMLEDIEEEIAELEIESEEDLELAKEEIILAIFKKYNSQFANIENLDIKHAMVVASILATIESSTTLTYRTQGDHRVRPWHAQYEGFSAPKRDFPAWLIPPIEHGCRCYLTMEAGVISSVKNKVVRFPEMPENFNRAFKESVALGGRIFSDEHPYFTVNNEHVDMLERIANTIKSKYING